MIKSLFLFVVLLLVSETIFAKSEVELKQVPLLEFMQGDLNQSYPIKVLVPEGYQGFEFEDEEPGSYYWMRPKDAKKAEQSQDLPTKKGYMYGKITLNVGYDTENDIFIGLEEPQVQAQFESLFSQYYIERTEVNGYPIVLVRMVQKGTDKATYMMYVALKVESNVVLIAYIPPKYNNQKGDYVWAEQLKNFVQQNEKPVNQ